MANPVVHFEIIGTDTAKLKQFYSEVFGWSIDTNNPIGYGMVTPGSERGIGGGVFAADEPQARGVTVYAEVPNLEATLQEVEKRGGRTIMPPTDVPGGPRMVQFLDPDGTRIGIIQAGSMTM